MAIQVRALNQNGFHGGVNPAQGMAIDY